MNKADPAQNSSKNENSRTIYLWGIAILFVGSAIVYRYLSIQTLPPLNPLYGNIEKAPTALENQIKNIPQSEREALLIKDTAAPTSGLRYAAVDELGQYHNSASANAVEATFRDNDSEVRKRALETLPQLARKRGTRLLMTALLDDDPWVREDAASQLIMLTSHSKTPMDKGVVPTLIKALTDPDGNVSSLAMDELKIIAKKPWHVSRIASHAARADMAKRWKNWWDSQKNSWKEPAYLTNIVPLDPTRTDPAPDYSIQMLDRPDITRETQKGRITLINFWGMGCSPCMEEQPQFNQLSTLYAGQPVDIIGAVAAQSDQHNQIESYIKKYHILNPQGIASPLLSRQFGDIDDVPVTVLMDMNGRICHVWQGGPRIPAPFQTAINKLLKKGENP